MPGLGATPRRLMARRAGGREITRAGKASYGRAVPVRTRTGASATEVEIDPGQISEPNGCHAVAAIWKGPRNVDQKSCGPHNHMRDAKQGPAPLAAQPTAPSTRKSRARFLKHTPGIMALT